MLGHRRADSLNQTLHPVNPVILSKGISFPANMSEIQSNLEAIIYMNPISRDPWARIFAAAAPWLEM